MIFFIDVYNPECDSNDLNIGISPPSTFAVQDEGKFHDPNFKPSDCD